jgi:hypothetical protein
MSEIIKIPNIDIYSQEIIDGALILTPKNQTITSQSDFLNNYNHLFNGSTIIECIIINNINQKIISNNQTKYTSILQDIWKSMPTQLIIQETTFKFKLTDENNNKGYKWYPELMMSYQRKDAKDSITEMLKMCNLNNYSINFKIKLSSNAIINFIKND